MVGVQRVTGFFHPSREDQYDSTIYDAEWEADIEKRINEQRHEMAMKCVELGIYKDTYEAQKTKRALMLEKSKYKYKDLLYRE